MQRIKKGDQVIVVAGKDKGRRGTVLRLVAGRVVVENLNVAKKHQRPNPQKGVAGGIVEQEKSLDASNVMLFNPTTQKADRVGYRRLSDGRKVRFFKGNGEVLDT
ncbi:MAG TPA: 50S ribosomal protein L24 [Gammaproteobacteria bacterium]|nr:50S ribosomal protein L24 [Gammaproteobacteria bacterium]